MQITVPFLLFAIFLVLKLAGIIAWSWWWVFSPLWISLIFIALVWALLIWKLTKEMHKDGFTWKDMRLAFKDFWKNG